MKEKIKNIFKYIKNSLTQIMRNKLFCNIVLIFGILFMIEIIFRVVSSLEIFNWSLFRVSISSLIFSFTLSIILSFTKGIISKITIITISAIISIYAMMQAGFLNFLGVYISFGTSSQLGAVKEYISDYIASFKWQYLFLLIPLVLITLYYIFLDKKLKLETKRKNSKNILLENKKLKTRRISFAIYTIVLAFIYYMSLSTSFMQDPLQVVSNEALFKNPSMPNIAVKEFGIFSYGLIDVKSTILPHTEVEEAETFEKEVTEITNYSRQIDDTLWEELNKKEKDAFLNTLNNYYLSKSITPENEYTGIFEDKNLIIIMLESVNNLIIDKELYPNIYELYSKGWSWENSYSPRNSCSTGNNEMSAVTSLYTINNSCTANAYRANTYYNSIYNLFNAAGYYSSSYHNYNDKFYYRNQYHYNFGSQNYMDAKKLGISLSSTYGEYPSDVELMKKSFGNYINEEQFFSFIITVSAHHPYSSSTVMGDQFMKDYKNITPYTVLQRYLSKLKEVDNSIGTLMQSLKESNKLDDTVIVIYADHYPYAINTSQLQTLFDENLEERRNIDKTPFIIYNTEIESKSFTEYTTFMNILPTIANLFGLDYDPRIYAGHDLFDKNYPNYAVFADGSWVDENAYYNANTGKIYYVDDSYPYDKEIILGINTTINNKIKMSNISIMKNYFAYLEENVYNYKKSS